MRPGCRNGFGHTMRTRQAADPPWYSLFLFSTPFLVLFSKDDPDGSILTKATVIPDVAILLPGKPCGDR